MSDGGSLVSRRESVFSTELGEAVAIMEVEDGAYYDLSDSAARIWRLLDVPRTIDELCGQLTGLYKVSSETCRAEVTTFVHELQRLKLVDIA